MRSKHRRIRVTEGSGNVFADVGIAHPEEYIAKAELARQIIGALDARRNILRPRDASRALGAADIKAPDQAGFDSKHVTDHPIR